MSCSVYTANRLGFAVLGLTNNFAYVIMLSAAYDLLKPATNTTIADYSSTSTKYFIDTSSLENLNTTSTLSLEPTPQDSFCNQHSTSTILLADTLPSLTTKLLYPIVLVNLPNAHKAMATALSSAIAFLVAGLSQSQFLIFTGVVCASLASGLGESTYLSLTPLYGDVSLSGWSMGTGAAGLLGAGAYAILRMFLSIKMIMLIMLVVPIAMVSSYFYVISPLDQDEAQINTTNTNSEAEVTTQTLNTSMGGDEQPIGIQAGTSRNYGASEPFNSQSSSAIESQTFSFKNKILYLPRLARYFLPLLVVYFAEYFINQGLFELIFYPEVKILDHAAQYRWFQVCYQFGVMVSRSSLDVVRIRNLWAMSLLQVLNAIIFLAHAAKLIYIPSFYIVVLLIIYEGLLGGFTYVNAFFRVKKEIKPDKREFALSTVTIADTLGIVFAAIAALPTHNALCKLYN